jgi:uncharacterized protein
VEHAADLLAACGQGSSCTTVGIAGVLFATGLVGGFGHCATMCGPFVLMQVADAGRPGPTLRKLAAGALPGYQIGRLTTYAALGAVAGGIGGSFAALSQFRWALALLLGVAAVAFLLTALERAAPQLRAWLPRLDPRVFLPMTRFLARLGTGAPDRHINGYRLGLLLGFLPCGFLYAALFASAAAGSVLAGATAMAAFALGTMPALIVVGIVGAGILQRWRRSANLAAAPLFVINAAVLLALAVRAAG